MNTYHIWNRASGHDFGTYQADTENGALDAMARDAGYKSAADAAEVASADDLEVVRMD